MKSVDIELKGKKGTGIEIPLPKAPLVLAFGKNGFVMCGYLNVDVAEKMDVAAAVVRGVSSVNDLLKAKIVDCTKAASSRGIKVGMTGEQALSLLL